MILHDEGGQPSSFEEFEAEVNELGSTIIMSVGTRVLNL